MTYEEWETSSQRRYDRQGLVEHFCKHGIGHPNPGSALWIAETGMASTAVLEDLTPKEVRERVLRNYESQMVHGCDGCCNRLEFPDFRDSLMRAHEIIRSQNAALRTFHTTAGS